jgi:anaerobic magnesium-protoporphyrin IX monomethyl ester cyclase
VRSWHDMDAPPLAANAEIDLSARVKGRPLRVVLATFYNYESHALRIFHPMLTQRGHDVHSIYFKNYFTYFTPSAKEEDMFVELIERLEPDLIGMSVWSTYYQLAARLTRRIKASMNPVVIWGGIHPQTRPENCLQHADIVCKGEYVLADLTDRLSVGEDYTDLPGCWVRTAEGIARNPPRPLIDDLDALPVGDMSSANKYYLGADVWRDVAYWDEQAVLYDVMAVRGCPYQCTFCIHNFTRKASEGMGTYVRRRSVDHVMEELHAAVKARPHLRTISFSDDIFAPSRPWLEEFCDRYRREINLPWAMYSFPTLVNERKIELMRDGGLWATVMGIQSGSARIRRDCYQRETSQAAIIEACRIFTRHGITTTFDFIGDNPYEQEEDRRETLGLLADLPKPFHFNFLSLTYFPGVGLTERALQDGFIRPEDVEDIAQKGYHLWGGSLVETRPLEDLCWDVAYSMAAHGFPFWFVDRLRRSDLLRRHIFRFVRLMRFVESAARKRARLTSRIRRRPDLFEQHVANANRDGAAIEPVVMPNHANAPFNTPVGVASGGS